MIDGNGDEPHERNVDVEKDETSCPKGTSMAKGSSQYRGVAQHRITRRWESHIWNNKRQVYLGSFETEEQAAEAYDKAAICLKAASVPLNFGMDRYDAGEVKLIRGFSKEELVAHLRRGSNGFCRGKATYRGVSWRPNTGRWEARISGLVDKKYTYLGTFDTSEEAAEAYDWAAILCKGRNAITNFDISRYEKDLGILDGASELGTTRSAASIKRIIQVAKGKCQPVSTKRASSVKENTKNKEKKDRKTVSTRENTKLQGKVSAAPVTQDNVVVLDAQNFPEQNGQLSIDGTLWPIHASPSQAQGHQLNDRKKRERLFASPQRNVGPTRLPDGQWTRSMQFSTPGTSYNENNLSIPAMASPMPLPKDLFPTPGIGSPLLNLFDTPKNTSLTANQDPSMSLSFKELLELHGTEEGMTPVVGRSARGNRDIYQQLFPDLSLNDAAGGSYTGGANGQPVSLTDLSNLNIDFLDSVLRNHTSGRIEWESPLSKKMGKAEHAQR